MIFGRKKKPAHETHEDDPNCLGEILVKMGACERAQIEWAAEEKAKASEDRKLGMFLVAQGLITRDALEAALAYQADLRSNARHKQAIAESRIAQHQASSVVTLARSTQRAVTERVHHIRNKTTGTGHPAITPAMLAAKAGDD